MGKINFMMYSEFLALDLAFFPSFGWCRGLISFMASTRLCLGLR